MCGVRCWSPVRRPTRARARRRGALPVAAPARGRGGAVQGAEHVEQLRRDGRRRRDRPGAGHAGARPAASSPSVAINPVLLKPGSDRSAQVVRARPRDGTVSARLRTSSARRRCWTWCVDASPTCARGSTSSSARVPASPAEINLRATDIANMGLARAADLPVVVVGDIDRGGVLAHLFGTVAVLARTTSALHRGLRDQQVPRRPVAARPGLDQLTRAHRPSDVRGRAVAEHLWLDAEDSLAAVADGVLGRPAPPSGASGCGWPSSGCRGSPTPPTPRRWRASPAWPCATSTEPARLADADLVVLPGTRATVADLAWLRRTGLADAVRAHAAAGRPVLGICGGYQMLGQRIADPDRVEGGDAAGLGLLDLEIVFDVEKHLANPVGHGVGRAGARLRDPLRPRRPLRRSRADRRRGLRQRHSARHPLARPPRERRLPPRAAAPGRRPGGAQRFRGRAGHRVRARAGRPARPARRPRRGAPRHRGVGACHRSRCRRRTSR